MRVPEQSCAAFKQRSHMPSAFMWLRIACVAVSALATQQGEGSTACVREDGCEVLVQEDEVLLLQLQLNGERARVSAETVEMEIEKRSEETERVAQMPGGDSGGDDSFTTQTSSTQAMTFRFDSASAVLPPGVQNISDPWLAIDGDLDTVYTAEDGTALMLSLSEPRYIGQLQITFGLCMCENFASMEFCRPSGSAGWNCRYLSGPRIPLQESNVKMVMQGDVDGVVNTIRLQAGLGYNTVPPLASTMGRWQVWEVTATNSMPSTSSTTTIITTTTTTSTTKTMQVNAVNWQPPGTPVRIDCQYPHVPWHRVRSVIEVACGDAFKLTSILATALIAGPEDWRLPAKISSDILQRMQLRSEKYFVNAPLEAHRVLSTQGFGLLADGLASMVGGDALKDFTTLNSLWSAGALKEQIATWIDSDNSVKLWEAVSAGALDMVASVSGPFGAGFTFVSSILSSWGTEDNKAHLERIAKEIKEEVAGFVASQIYEEELARTQGYIKVFTQRLENALEAFQAISLRVPANGGMQQFILLSDLESELAVTRSEWLLFSKEAQPGCNDCNDDCDPQKAMPHIVPVLITMHLALLQQMSFCVVSDNVLAYQVQKKFYQHAFEYYLYMRRIGMGVLWNNFVYGFKVCRAPYGDARQNDTIDVCCADSSPETKDPLLLKSIDSTSNSGAFGLGYRLLDLARLGQYRGFINEAEILGEITFDPTWKDAWAAEEQEGTSLMMKEEGKQSPGLSDVNDKNGHTSMSRPIALEQSRGRTTTRLAKAGHAFDSAPNLQPPRSSWESKYRKICGDGLACLREEITQEKAEAFNMLALEVGRSLKEQGILK